jgi:hypothetical protein
MSELSVERKTAIEVIHFRGHTPIYIETEPEVRDEKARDTMLTLLKDADAFVSLYYLSEGYGEKVLDDKTPIEFELFEFRRLHPEKPVLFFQRTPDRGVRPSERMLEFFRRQAAEIGTEIRSFAGPKALQPVVAGALHPYELSSDNPNVSQRITIRYVGPDFIGLVGRIAEVLFTTYKLNIDDISHTAAGIHAIVSVACSPRHSALTPEHVDTGGLRAQLLSEIESARLIAAGDNKTLSDLTAAEASQVFVDQNPLAPRECQFYVIIRAIDAPGQINAVCKELRDRHFNIDKLQITPTPAEYPRQRTMALLLSRHDGLDSRETVDLIEGALQYLVGVRAFSIRAIGKC